MSKQIAIVYHSGYGHTQRQAEAVQAGIAGIAGVEASLYPVSQLTEEQWLRLDAADAMIFGSPTYLGAAAAKFREFVEASSKRWYGRAWQDKLAAGFTCSASQSGDKLNTLVEMFLFAQQHGMLWVGLGMLPGNNSSAGSVNDLNRLGSFAGAMAQANADQGSEAMLQSDLDTAAALGRRVAESLIRLK